MLFTISAQARVYYIDSRSGNDRNSGTSRRSPWKSFAPLNALQLQPGDSVCFKRGASFTGPLYIHASGTETAPITITDYGNPADPAPSFTNPVFTEGNYGNCIRIGGSYVTVSHLYCHNTAAYKPVKYEGKGWVEWEMGAIHIDSGAEHCTVRDNEIRDCVAGIRSDGRYALIERNYIHDCNRVLKEWNWGPIGIWLGADEQEVRYNRVFNYSAVDPRIGWGPDSYGSGADGGAMEIDDARNEKSHIEIHHNYTRDCQGFLEVTWTDVKQNPAYKNFRIHHNVSDDYQQFIALWRGEGCYIEQNTIIRRKVNANDWGVFNITQRNARNTIRNNIIVTEKGVTIFNVGRKGTAKPNDMISGNLYFAASGQLEMGKEGPGDAALITDPMFVNYAHAQRAEDFRLSKSSPAAGLGAFDPAPVKIPVARDGKALISVCIPAQPSITEQFAAQELLNYLDKISGAHFISHSGAPDGPSIIVQQDKQLSEEAYTIAVTGHDILLKGGSARAELFAVYDLLRRMGCAWIAPDFSFYDGASEYIPHASLLNYEAPAVVREQPQFAYRKLDIEEGRSHTIANMKQMIDWMPKVRLNSFMVPLNYQGNGKVMWDNWRDSLTPELQKRGLIIEVGGHGYQNFLPVADAARNRVFNTQDADTVQLFLSHIKTYLEQHPEIGIFDLWPPDVARWSDPGRASELQAELVNTVDAFIHKIRPGLKLEIIAYGQVLEPPRQTALNDDILVDICPINQSFERPLFESSDSNNRVYAAAMRSWRRSFKGALGLYSYYRKYAWRSLPVVLPHYMRSELQGYAALSFQAISTYAEPGDWMTYELNHYTLAALAWDPSLSVDSLMRAYVRQRFGTRQADALQAYQALEQMVPHYGSLPYTTRKSAEALAKAIATLTAQQKTLAAGTPSLLTQRLSWMLEYAIRDLDILRSQSAHVDDREVREKVLQLVEFLHAHTGQGIFLTGKNDQETFLKHYGIK